MKLIAISVISFCWYSFVVYRLIRLEVRTQKRRQIGLPLLLLLVIVPDVAMAA